MTNGIHLATHVSGRLWLETCFHSFMGEHIPMDYAWTLIQEGSPLDAAEARHLRLCSDCREFLRSFVSVARYVGYSVRFPDLDPGSDWERAA